MKVLTHKPYLAGLIMFLLFFSNTSFGANWKYLFCNNPETHQSIELDLTVDQKASLKTKESVYLLYQMPCQGVSSEGPYVQCSDYFSSDSRNLFSFMRIENGFVDGYSRELFNEKVFYIIFERYFQNAQSQLQSIKREFKFKSNDCVWE